MHNGVVGGFSRIKRRLLEQLSDAAYNSIQSFHSDSAVSFAVFLNKLPDLVNQHTPDMLVTAMQVGGWEDWQQWCAFCGAARAGYSLQLMHAQRHGTPCTCNTSSMGLAVSMCYSIGWKAGGS